MKEFQDGDPLFGAMMHAIANLWPNGTAVLSGCAPTGSGSARQVAVAAGTVVINGAVVSVSQQTKTLDAATFDRYDLVSVNASGQAVVTKGVDTRRVPPVPANSVPIAICLVETGATTLPADRIYDARMDALRVSALTIDANKDWAGKDITNIGTISCLTGNIGAYQGFVDVAAGETTLRKSQVQTFSVTGNQTVTMMSFTIPSIYSPTIPSNCSIRCKGLRTRTLSCGGYVKVYRNGTEIGSQAISGYDSAQWQPVFHTTGGFVGGDTIEIKLVGTGCSGWAATITEVYIYSSRSTTVPANKVFPEEGVW